MKFDRTSSRLLQVRTSLVRVDIVTKPYRRSKLTTGLGPLWRGGSNRIDPDKSGLIRPAKTEGRADGPDHTLWVIRRSAPAMPNVERLALMRVVGTETD
jgi:hypothetical protein